MQPFKRRRRTRRDMVVLGGWLFADLLLGLAMLFLVANTVGSEPATPTPTAEPDYLATATVEFAAQQAENEETIAALQGDLAQVNQSAEETAAAIAQQQQNAAAAATETAIAVQTQAAMSEEERADAAAQATEAAVNSQATVDAISTEQAANQYESDQAAIDLATAAAQATELSQSIDAQSTQQAELQAIATENADSGAAAQGTVIALETAQAESQSALATSDANASNAQSTADALQSQQANVDATVAALEQEAQANTLNPQSVTETIQIDLNGVLSGDEGATDDAIEELHGVLDKYLEGNSCTLGFVNISTRAPDVPTGSQTSERIAQLIEQEFPELLPTDDDGSPSLANVPIAYPGTSPTGEVELQMFVNNGCQPTG
jgi:hypothetical protein